jgi:hypothetical protein
MNGFGRQIKTIDGIMQDEFCADRKSISKEECNGAIDY